MLYDKDWLMKFDGVLDSESGIPFKPSHVNINELVNSLEKHCSQYNYEYETNLNDFPTIKIVFKNENIPHLIGLSRNHHFNLPTYHPIKMFENLKKDWDLEYLIKADEKWFDESQDKLVGALLIYNLLNLIDSKTLTTIKWGRIQHQRFKRDDVYFIMIKDVEGKYYSLELAKDNPQEDWYFPRSFKINDTALDDCELIEIKLINKTRIKTKKKTKKKP